MKRPWILLFAALLLIPPASAAAADTQPVLNTSNGHFYQRFDLPGIWMQGKLFCEEKGGYLATLTTLQEDKFLFLKVLNRLPGQSYYWLGGTDEDTEGRWRWVTGEPWGFQNWEGEEPNNFRGSENCANYNSRLGRTPGWNDLSCVRETFGFVCEWDGDPRSASPGKGR